MKKIFGLLCVCSLFLAVPGCGGSGEPQSVSEGADQSAVEAYQAAEAADREAMSDMDKPVADE